MTSESAGPLEQLRWIGWAQGKAGEDWLRARELSFSQSVVLRYLVDNPGVIQRDIVRMTRTTEASVSSLLGGLERRGLIERRTTAASARTKQVYPTPAGIALADGLDDAMAAVEESILAPLDPAERAAFSTLLAKITARLPAPPHS